MLPVRIWSSRSGADIAHSYGMAHAVKLASFPMKVLEPWSLRRARLPIYRPRLLLECMVSSKQWRKFQLGALTGDSSSTRF